MDFEGRGLAIAEPLHIALGLDELLARPSAFAHKPAGVHLKPLASANSEAISSTSMADTSLATIAAFSATVRANHVVLVTPQAASKRDVNEPKDEKAMHALVLDTLLRGTHEDRESLKRTADSSVARIIDICTAQIADIQRAAACLLINPRNRIRLLELVSARGAPQEVGRLILRTQWELEAKAQPKQ